MSELQINSWENYINENGIEPIVTLERTCWASWLAASPQSLAGRANVFPEGQLCVYSKLGLLATLSANKIAWNGLIDMLPTWDDVAGDPTTYEHTYESNGNTLCLMSMNVSPLGRGKQLPKVLIGSLIKYAKKSDIQHVIGSFRPSAFSQAVLQATEQGVQIPTFEVYCGLKNESGDCIDPWLRSLSKNGMQPLAVDHKAMQVPISKDEFEHLLQPSWRQLTIKGKDIWWCNETGFFYPQEDGSFLYCESNLWGTLYEKQSL